MSLPARSYPELPEPSPNTGPLSDPAVSRELSLSNPAAPQQKLRLVEVPPPAESPPIGKRKDREMLRGLKDLQQLQKQTIAVLEAIKGGLDDIQQVLRSPEATRGLEKQQNAVMLLAKGFAREAADQAAGACALLPANPEPHLLLALSLSADQRFDESLAAARKGIALFDPKQHPLAIEAGLLHAIAALGYGPEAVERWGEIINTLPQRMVYENIARIAACFPADAPEGQLDQMLNRRLMRNDLGRRKNPEKETLEAAVILIGLDAAQQAKLPITHRAILGQIARRLQDLDDPSDLLRFLTDFVVPLSTRNLERTACALGRSAAKRLLIAHAHAPMLHRAMQKLQMAGDTVAVLDLAMLLRHWRKTGNLAARSRRMLQISAFLTAGGAALFAYMLLKWGVPVGAMKSVSPFFWLGPAMLIIGAGIGLAALLARSRPLMLPYHRGPLSSEELACVNSPEVKATVRGVLTMQRNGS